VNDAKSLTFARKHFSDKQYGVVFMIEEFGIGADVKCQGDAHVMVYVPED
jgi:hypothetical protein